MILNNPVTKTKAAFLMSAARLFNEYPAIYFWTFTFKGVEYDERAMYLWQKFQGQLQDFFGGGVAGLRVVEVHEGEFSHGLHFHALISKRLNVHIIKRIGKRWGFGRISVCKCDVGAALYLSKYLSKENDVARGVRRWGAMGGFHPVKVRDIEIDSVLSRNIRWVQDKIKTRQFSYAFFLHVSKMTYRYGSIVDWPDTRCILPQRAQLGTVVEVEADDFGEYYVTHRNKWQPSELRVKVGNAWKWASLNERPF